MGNTPSSEAPRKAPQKLSKPRIGSHQPTPGVLSPCGASASNSTRCSSSYLAASFPLSPRHPTRPPVQNAIPDEFLEGHRLLPRRVSGRESDWTEARPVSDSPRPERKDGRCYSLYGTSSAGDRLSRTNSMVYSDTGRTLFRTQSWHGRRIEKSRPVQSEMDAYGPQRLLGSSECAQEPQAVGVESHLKMHQSTGTSSLHLNQLASTPLIRTTSDLSLYAPVRRRSIIQTPGIATRPQRDDLPFMQDKSKFRRSQPLPLMDQPSFKSTNTTATKHFSMPPQPIQIEPHERAVTPCESDYKQLGGMKFGSLRITNGSPVSSCAPKKDLRPSSRSSTQSSTLSTEENVVEEHHGDMEIVQPRPHINIVSPIVSTFAEACSSPPNVYDMSRGSTNPNLKLDFLDGLMPSPFPNDSNFPQFDFQPAPLSFWDAEQPERNDENTTGLARFELTDVQQDLTNGLPPYNDALDPSGKYVGGVSRSDSGIGSTSSSDTSRQTLSKADSGYSSNLSISSLQTSSQDLNLDQFMRLNTNSQSRQHTKPGRRTLEKPPPASFVSDGHHKNGKLYDLLVSSERKGANMDHARRRVSNPLSAVISEAENLKYRNRSTSASRRYSHKVGPSSATLNTILSVESLPHPTDLPTSRDTGKTKLDKPLPPLPPLKRRRSLRAVADFAQAATSRMPSLKLYHRKSITGRLSRSDQNDSSERRETSMPAHRNRQTGTTKSSNASNNSTPAHERISRSRSNPRTPTKAPTKPGQTPTPSESGPYSLRNRASAPNLRESMPDQPHTSLNTSERSSQMKQRAASPKSHRSRRMKDPGIPPPIPPQFRPFKSHASPAPLLPQKNCDEFNMPLCSLLHSSEESHDSLAHASTLPEPCEYVRMGQTNWLRPIRRHPAQDQDQGSAEDVDKENTSYRVLHSYNSPAYKGVPIWG